MSEGNALWIPTYPNPIPHSVPSVQGHRGCPSFWLQGKRQLQSFILMSLLSRVMTRTRQETRSFSVKTWLPGLGLRGLLPYTAAPSYDCGGARGLVEAPDWTGSFCPEFFLFFSFPGSCYVPRAFFSKEKSNDLAVSCSHGVLKSCTLTRDHHPHHCLTSRWHCGSSYSLSH